MKTPHCHYLGMLLIAISALLAQACMPEPDRQEPSAMASIKVQATYRERILLAPGSSLRVVMEDTAIMDIAAPIIAEVVVVDPGSPPFAVTLPYDPSLIHDRGRYALRAQIHRNEQLLFTSTTHIAAFEPDAQGVIEVVMQRIPSDP